MRGERSTGRTALLPLAVSKQRRGKRLLDVVQAAVRSCAEIGGQPHSRTLARNRTLLLQLTRNPCVHRTARQRPGVRLSSAAFLGTIKFSKPFFGRLDADFRLRVLTPTRRVKSMDLRSPKSESSSSPTINNTG